MTAALAVLAGLAVTGLVFVWRSKTTRDASTTGFITAGFVWLIASMALYGAMTWSAADITAGVIALTFAIVAFFGGSRRVWSKVLATLAITAALIGSFVASAIGGTVGAILAWLGRPVTLHLPLWLSLLLGVGLPMVLAVTIIAFNRTRSRA